MSITDRPCQLHIRDAGRFRRAAARLGLICTALILHLRPDISTHS